MACDNQLSESKIISKEEEEYRYGSSQEIYKIKVGDGLIGKTFSQVSSIIYNEYGLAAIAIERENNKSTLSINPGSNWEVKKSDRIFVLTNNYEDAEKI